MSPHDAPAREVWPGFPDHGEMAALVRAHDWSATPLGPVEAWPQSLRTAIDLMLGSRHPVYVAWGPELTSLYNDAYLPIVGAKHPVGLGQPFNELWSEIRDEYRPLVEAVMAGEAQHFVDRPAALGGREGVEIGYFTFSWTPLRDEAGVIRGFICNGLETTERVEAGRAFRRMFEVSPTPFLVLTPDVPRFTIIEVNDAYLAAVMRTREELIGRGVFEALPDNPDDPGATGTANLRASLNRAIATKQPDAMPFQRYDIPHTYGGFEERWWNPVNSPLLGAGGNVEALIHHVVDVTERHRAEEHLRESEARFRSMADHAPVMMWVTDPSGHCTYLNRRWYEFTGQVEGAGDGYGWLDAVHPEDRAAAEEAFISANACQRDYRVDFRLRRADGVYRWTIDAAAARFGSAGEFLGYVGSVIDIDERREVEDALRISEERLRLAVDNAEVGFWDVDVVHDVLIWPAQTKAMFGISPQVPVTMADFYNGLHPDDRQATREAYIAATDPARRALYDVEYRTVGKEDRVIRWVAATGRGLFDGEGPEARCLRVIGTALDITARKATQERLRELNETLEQRVVEEVAKRAKAEEALRQSQKLESMGQLTGGVAHDFNNLLTPIIGSLDMLQRRGLGNEREQRLIAGAAQAAERAKTLVQRLLAFARRQPLQPVPVDIGKLVAGMADLVVSTSGPRVRVEVDVAPSAPAVTADPNQLEMAILNLAVNARDAMPEGGALTIVAKPDAVAAGHRSGLAPGHYVRLSVSDTGTGMDAETARRAVEPFFSTKGVGKGTGLGLSMVHGLASQLGGTMTIQSRRGFGTVVELWLPVATTKAIEADNSERTVEAPAGTALLVDDEELVRASTADMLSDLGYVVVEAVSAEEALRLVDDGLTPDIVVTDHLMPGMAGTDLARTLKKRRPAPKVLIISGYAEDEGVAPDLPRLTKPFRQAELAASLTDLFKAGG